MRVVTLFLFRKFFRDIIFETTTNISGFDCFVCAVRQFYSAKLFHTYIVSLDSVLQKDEFLIVSSKEYKKHNKQKAAARKRFCSEKE